VAKSGQQLALRPKKYMSASIFFCLLVSTPSLSLFSEGFTIFLNYERTRSCCDLPRTMAAEASVILLLFAGSW
jgi:hypothetical protein